VVEPRMIPRYAQIAVARCVLGKNADDLVKITQTGTNRRYRRAHRPSLFRTRAIAYFPCSNRLRLAIALAYKSMRGDFRETGTPHSKPEC